MLVSIPVTQEDANGQFNAVTTGYVIKPHTINEKTLVFALSKHAHYSMIIKCELRQQLSKSVDVHVRWDFFSNASAFTDKEK